MGAALDGVDVVHVGVDVLRVVGVVHHGHLDGNALLLGLQVDDIVEEVGAVTVHVAHELLQALLGVEHFRLAQVALLVGTQVGQRDGDAGVQVGQLAHALGNDVVLISGGGEDGAVGPELLARTGLVVEGLALLIFLLVDVAVAEHLRLHVGGEGVDARHAHAVQTARHLVGAFVELTACVQHGHHHFQGTLVHLLMLVHGNTAAIVLHGDAVILVDGHFDMRAIAGHRLVDRVVDGLVD